MPCANDYRAGGEMLGLSVCERCRDRRSRDPHRHRLRVEAIVYRVSHAAPRSEQEDMQKGATSKFRKTKSRRSSRSAKAQALPITPIWLTVIYLEKHKKKPLFHTFPLDFDMLITFKQESNQRCKKKESRQQCVMLHKLISTEKDLVKFN